MGNAMTDRCVTMTITNADGSVANEASNEYPYVEDAMAEAEAATTRDAHQYPRAVCVEVEMYDPFRDSHTEIARWEWDTEAESWKRVK